MSTSYPSDPSLPAPGSDQPTADSAAWQLARTPLSAPPSPLRTVTPSKVEAPQLDAKTLIKAFRRQWFLAVGAGLVLMGVVGGIAWVVVPSAKYTARAVLLVSPVRPRLIVDTAESTMDFSTYQRTQIALIQSRLVLGAVIRDPEVAQLESVKRQVDPIEWLEKELKVQFPGGSTVLEISMSGDAPADLATVVKSATRSYMKLVVLEEFNDRVKRLENLKRTWNEAQERLKLKRSSLRSMAERAGSDDRNTLLVKQQLDMETLAQLQREQIATQSQIRVASIRVKVLETTERSEVALMANEAEIEARLDNDPVVLEFARRLQPLRANLAAQTRLARNQHEAGIRKLQDQIREIEKATADYRNRTRPRLAALLSQQSRNDQKTDLEAARENLNMLIAQEQELSQEIERRNNKVRDLNLQTFDVQADQDEIALVSSIAQRVGQEVEALNLEIKAEQRVRVLNEADVPKQKDEMKRLKACGAAALGAFACGLFGVSFWEFRTRRVYSTDEVVQALGMNLVGTLPALPTPSGRGLARVAQADLDAWQNHMVESIDATRTMLMHVARVEGIRSVMITSALKGEGKTSLSSHLATSLARAGLRTLLIDSDLRSPATHRLYDLPPEPGLCELLRGEIGLADAIVEVVGPSPLGTLSVIPAGRCDPQALQALAQDGMRNLLATLRTQFDFVIVDSAPVLPVVDTLMLGQQVDAVLFSILRDVSRVNHVHAAYDRLSRLGIRTLGAVISGENGSPYGYNYTYKYGSTP